MISLPCIFIPKSFNVQGHAVVYLQIFTSLLVLDAEYNLAVRAWWTCSTSRSFHASTNLEFRQCPLANLGDTDLNSHLISSLEAY